ncbi:MAG: alpha/beta fold hydrolase [Pseudomonadota bacterium]
MTRPLVVFSHANGFPSGSYRKFFSSLEPHVDIRALDMLAHDPRFPVNDNWGNLVHELLAFIDVHCDRPVFGLGHSMGALVTFMAAHRAAEKFRGIIMLDPPIINGWSAHVFQLAKWMGKADVVTPAAKSRNRRRAWPSREEAIADLGQKKLFANFDPDCLHDYVFSVTEERSDGFHLRFLVENELAIFRTTPSNPYRYLRRLQVPGAVITGATSEVSLQQHVSRLCRRHGMTHGTAPGGHMFPLEQPDEAARRVREQIHAWVQQAARSGGATRPGQGHGYVG